METKPVRIVADDEFEPLCKWRREDERDVLEIHLQEFRKDQLKVQISDQGILKISGERPLDDSRKSRFYKEVPIPKDYDTNGIRAKFINGWLFIVMPKKSSTSLNNEQAQPTPEDQTKKEPDQNGSKNAINGKQETTKDARIAESTPTVRELPPRKQKVWPLVRTFGKVFVTLAALVALMAYVVYMYKSVGPMVDGNL